MLNGGRPRFHFLGIGDQELRDRRQLVKNLKKKHKSVLGGRRAHTDREKRKGRSSATVINRNWEQSEQVGNPRLLLFVLLWKSTVHLLTVSITCGVPQACILELLLFSLHLWPPELKQFHFYADDSHIFVSLKVRPFNWYHETGAHVSRFNITPLASCSIWNSI